MGCPWRRALLLLLLVVVVVTAANHGVTAAAAGGEPVAPGEQPYLDDVQLIRVHMPLGARDRAGAGEPCPPPGQAPLCSGDGMGGGGGGGGGGRGRGGGKGAGGGMGGGGGVGGMNGNGGGMNGGGGGMNGGGGGGNRWMDGWLNGGDCNATSTTTTTTTATTTTTPTTTTPTTTTTIPTTAAAAEDGDATTLPSDDDLTTTPSPDSEDLTTTAYPTNEIVIPDAATLEVFNSNGSSVFNSSVTVFGFGGLYEVVVNRTDRAVEVTLTKLDDGLMAMEQPPEPVDLVIRGPSITGISEDEDDDDDDDADDRFAVVIYDEVEEDDEDTAAAEEDQKSLQGRRYLRRGRWPKGRRRAAKRRGAHPIYINGTALTGRRLCNIAFNVSGVFQLNRTITAKTTTVIITQLISTGHSRSDGPHGLLATSAENMIGTSGGVATSTILILMAVCAGAVLLAAVIVTVIRGSRRSEAILKTGGARARAYGNTGYGTIAEGAGPGDYGESWRYYNSFE